MPRFATRSIRKSSITPALKRYEKYVQSIDDDSVGSLTFRESEDISLHREALRVVSSKLGIDLIIRRPRGINNKLQFRLRDKKGKVDDTDGHQKIVRSVTISTWCLDSAETDRIFDGPDSVVGTWRQSGGLSKALAEIDTATNLLRHYLKPDRIPTVVRKSIPARGDVSLLAMLEQGDAKKLMATCRDMFRFEQTHV